MTVEILKTDEILTLSRQLVHEVERDLKSKTVK